MGQVHQDTLDSMVIRHHNYIKTQQTGELTQNTADGTNILGHHRIERYFMTHQITWLLDRQLHKETVNGRVKLGYSRWDKYIKTPQMIQVQYEILDRMVIRQENYNKIQQTGELNQDTANGTNTLRHHRWQRYIWTHQIRWLLDQTNTLTHQTEK